MSEASVYIQALADELFELYTGAQELSEERVLDACRRHFESATEELRMTKEGYRLRCHSAENKAANLDPAIDNWRETLELSRQREKKHLARIKELERLLLDAFEFGELAAAAEIAKLPADVVRQFGRHLSTQVSGLVQSHGEKCISAAVQKRKEIAAVLERGW